MTTTLKRRWAAFLALSALATVGIAVPVAQGHWVARTTTSSYTWWAIHYNMGLANGVTVQQFTGPGDPFYIGVRSADGTVVCISPQHQGFGEKPFSCAYMVTHSGTKCLVTVYGPTANRAFYCREGVG